MITTIPPVITSPAIEQAKAACVEDLADIERKFPGDGGSLKVPYGNSFVRVTCYHKNGQLVVHVTKPHRVRHYHPVFSNTRP